MQKGVKGLLFSNTQNVQADVKRSSSYQDALLPGCSCMRFQVFQDRFPKKPLSVTLRGGDMAANETMRANDLHQVGFPCSNYTCGSTTHLRSMGRHVTCLQILIWWWVC